MHKLLSFLFLLTVCCIAAGCQREENKEPGTADDEDFSKIPGMVTTDVSMLVSDSGVIRYHANTPIWYTYNLDAKKSYWYFPEGIELQQLDEELQPAGKLQADTAYHFEKEQQWHLIGNVRVSNNKGEKFNTEELYWDMKKHTVYSDSFIHIERNRDILEGFGFNSNEAFTEYEIRQTTGIFEMRQQQDGSMSGVGNEAPDDGEHLAENDEPGTISPTDTIQPEPMTPQEKAALARQRRNHTGSPKNIPFDNKR